MAVFKAVLQGDNLHLDPSEDTGVPTLDTVPEPRFPTQSP